MSSDGDFTRLASRLRESGMEVIGMGESKTPKSFRGACSVFTNIELLLEGDKEENKKEKKKCRFQKENFGCCFGSYYDKRKQWKRYGTW